MAGGARASRLAGTISTSMAERNDISASDDAAGAVGHVIVAAYNEADRIGDTVKALRDVFASAEILVCDDGSDDATVKVAEAAGATVLTGSHLGKGQAASRGAEYALRVGAPDISQGRAAVLLADGDLTNSAAKLTPLAAEVSTGRADISVAIFAKRVGGGIGAAKGFAHWAIERRVGFDASEPISGQRALSYEALAAVSPFHDGFGMEIGMTVNALRAGLRLEEIELPLEHRATGKKLKDWFHRGRQMRDFIRTYRALARPRSGAR